MLKLKTTHVSKETHTREELIELVMKTDPSDSELKHSLIMYDNGDTQVVIGV